MKTLITLLTIFLVLASPAFGTGQASVTKASGPCTHCNCGGSDCCASPAAPVGAPQPVLPPPIVSRDGPALPALLPLYVLAPAAPLPARLGAASLLPAWPVDVALFCRNRTFLI